MWIVKVVGIDSVVKHGCKTTEEELERKADTRQSFTAMKVRHCTTPKSAIHNDINVNGTSQSCA